MNRRHVVLSLGGLMLCSGCGVLPTGQSSRRLARVGYLAANTQSPQRWQAFIEEMRGYGWEEGRNLNIEMALSEPRGNNGLLPELATDLQRSSVDVIVTGETPAVLAAKAASVAMPI